MLASKNYIPLLRTGLAEIEAYKFLSAESKALIFPIFQARPWPNANHLDFTIEKILDAVDGHTFGLTLDDDRKGYSSKKLAQTEFDSLFDSSRGYKAYHDWVESVPGAVPVLRPSKTSDEILLQLGRADTLNRGLIVHQRRGAVTPLPDLVINMPPLPADTVFVVDAGWARDYTQIEAWTLPIIARIHSALPNAELVTMCSSFPDSFSHIIGDSHEDANERRLFMAVKQRHNQAEVKLGDWGSTRTSSEGGGGKIPSRIDIPTPQTWHIFRSDPDHDLGYGELAYGLRNNPSFVSAPDCWGKRFVQITDDEGNGIVGTRSATQSRINIHMTIFSGSEHTISTDEVPYED